MREPPRISKKPDTSEQLWCAFLSQIRRYKWKFPIKQNSSLCKSVSKILNITSQTKLNRSKIFDYNYGRLESTVYLRTHKTYFTYRMLGYAHAKLIAHPQLQSLMQLKSRYAPPIPPEDLKILRWIDILFAQDAQLEKIKFSNVLEKNGNELCLVVLTSLAFLLDHQRLLAPLLKLYCNHPIGKKHIFHVLRGYGGIQHVDLVFKHHPSPYGCAQKHLRQTYITPRHRYYPHGKYNHQYPNPSIDKYLYEKINRLSTCDKIGITTFFAFAHILILAPLLLIDYVYYENGKDTLLAKVFMFFLNLLYAPALIYSTKEIGSELKHAFFPKEPAHQLLKSIKNKSDPRKMQSRQIKRRLTTPKTKTQHPEEETKFHTSVLSKPNTGNSKTGDDTPTNSQLNSTS